VRLEQTIPLELPRQRIGRQILLCSLLSAGLSAALAVAAIVWFVPAKTETARLENVQLDPKIVRTVSFKPEASPAPPPPVEADLQKPAPEAAPPLQPKEPAPPSKSESRNDQIAPKELLALWSGIPADVPAIPATEAPPPKVEDIAETARDEAEPVRERPARSIAHRRHAQVHRRPRPVRVRTARAQQRTQPATSGQAADAAPLQSALQSLFSRSAAAPAQTPQQQP
jgi:hypothetical protein